jgi:hypothetical protein
MLEIIMEGGLLFSDINNISHIQLPKLKHLRMFDFGSDDLNILEYLEVSYTIERLKL